MLMSILLGVRDYLKVEPKIVGPISLVVMKTYQKVCKGTRTVSLRWLGSSQIEGIRRFIAIFRKPSTGPYPEGDESSSHPLALLL
jgi:hypothetical protein